ncbi:MAG: ADP-ribosylglycohydrolase family protein [Clostridia bacterium]|nr:ADP-ribosylglycohydrolase family protein [Clostridia bacterium]
MLGLAVGDALGVPVEFSSREELDMHPVTDMRGWGTYPVPEGTWSDDTSMALATLDSLKHDRIDYNEIMENFVRWAHHDEYTATGKRFDIGGICSHAIQNFIMRGHTDALLSGIDGEHSNGNGSLMRIAPMAYYLWRKGYEENRAIEIIHNTSALTHAHMRSKVACGIYSFVLWELLRSPCKGSVLQGLTKARNFYRGEIERIPYEDRLMKRIGRVFFLDEKAENLPMPSREEIQSTGYVVDTLEAAIWCIMTTNDYKSCVLAAVNLGEDTDTVAAIAGSLAAILYGMDAIPAPWLTTLQNREYIETICRACHKRWKK